MAGVLTLLSVLYGLGGIGATVVAAVLVYRYTQEFAHNHGAASCERGVEFLGRPSPKGLILRVVAIGCCFAVGLTALILFAVAGLGLDRPTFSTHYTLQVLGRTYEEANVALFALLPMSAAGCMAIAAFALWRRLRMLATARVCLTTECLYGVSYEAHFLGCKPVAFEIRYGDVTRLRAERSCVVLDARARTIRCPASDSQALLRELEARAGLAATV